MDGHYENEQKRLQKLWDEYMSDEDESTDSAAVRQLKEKMRTSNETSPQNKYFDFHMYFFSVKKMLQMNT